MITAKTELAYHQFFSNRGRHSLRCMTVKITLPRTMTSAHIEPVIGLMQYLRESKGPVIADCSLLTFVDPFGLTALASTLDTVQASGRAVRFDFLSHRLTSYLERMDLFKVLHIDGVDVHGTPRNDRRANLCELIRLQHEHQAEGALERMAWAITGTAGGKIGKNPKEPELFVPLYYALSELVGNAVTHAKREGYHDSSVWIAAQYYPGSAGTVRLSVTDNGCGFLSTLRSHPSLLAQTHPEAIAAALRARVSCNRGVVPFGEPENQGVGLTTTARISKVADGGISIFSGDGLYHDSAANRSMKRSHRQRLIGPVWQGVGVVVDLSREKLAAIRIHELLPADAPPLSHHGNNPQISFV